MSFSRKEALNKLQEMFPTYDRSALDTLLRANGKHNYTDQKYV